MSLLRKGREILSFITSIVILIFLIVLLAYMVYSVGYVLNFVNGAYFLIPIYILVGVPVLLFYLGGFAAFIWYSLLVVIIGTSAILTFLYGAVPYYKEFFNNPFNGKDFSFKQLAEIYTVNMFFSVIVVLIMHLINYTPTTPGIGEYPLYSQMLLLIHASVYEEIVTRFVFVGIPVYLIYAHRGKRISKWKLLGGYGYIDNVGIVFMIISGFLFAFAHVPSWSWWKMVPTFVGGLLLAYLYLKYGIHASIMLHFMIDFMSIPMSFSPLWTFVFSSFILFFIVVGALFFISYFHRGVNYFMGKGSAEERGEAKPPAPPTPDTWTTARCPNCGGNVFQFVDEETLRCLNCGTEIKIKRES